MLFHSFQYLLFFAAVMAGAKVLQARRAQHLFLLGASLCFYAAWNAALVLLIVGTAWVDFHLARGMAAAPTAGRRRVFLIFSLVSNLGVLGFFKYTNFLAESFYQAQVWLGLGWWSAPPHFNILLPVGISFYTFQTLSYTVDVYRGRVEPLRDFVRFLLYISFFPQLVAGPIVRAGDFLPQLERRAEVRPENFKLGFTLFLGGLLKKVVFADSLGLFVEKIYTEPTLFSSVPIILATVAYAVQIYCDFSGYTDMALGSAAALGFWLPGNFAHPYFAASVSEFWQRWHISLSSWLRDYLYIPLGGNRRGTHRTHINLMTVMLLGGLWHGARWTFVCWGAYQGVLLALHRLFARALDQAAAPRWLRGLRQSRPWHWASVAVTFYCVLGGWVLFRAENFGDMAHLLRKFVLFDGLRASYGIYLREALAAVVLIAGFVALHTLSHRLGGLARRLAAARNLVWCGCLTGGLYLLLCLAPSRSPEFIYFQF
jgi:alginate O-acetyltransferase complex protein AlgI